MPKKEAEMSTSKKEEESKFTIKLASGTVQRALADIGVYGPDIGIDNCDDQNKSVTFDLSKVPSELLTALANSRGVSKNIKQQVKTLLAELDGEFDFAKPVRDLYMLSRMMLCIAQNNTAHKLGLMLAGRKYPVKICSVSVRRSMFGTYLFFECKQNVCEVAVSKRVYITPSDLVDDETKEPRNLTEILLSEQLHAFSPDEQVAFDERLHRSNKMRKSNSLLVDVHTNVLTKNMWLWNVILTETTLGTVKRPKQLIVDSEMEVDAEDSREYDDDGESTCPLPFIRAFSLDLKSYVYADVDDVHVHEFDSLAHDRLVLPKDMKSVLLSVFESEGGTGDMFAGRHGGMVIMANGPSGVGKTLTAEVFAEHTKRPLYTLEMGELGTDLQEVEKSLQLIFARATRWNAVLLFDEADIFLSKRSENDLERSAIVGVFLRLLDRYEGTFFLTTNRGDVIDPAFKSRITLYLNYPPLSHASRKVVWHQMLTQVAGFEVRGSLDAVAEKHDVNGRQIRNIARLLRAIAGPEATTLETSQIEVAMQYVAK